MQFGRFMESRRGFVSCLVGLLAVGGVLSSPVAQAQSGTVYTWGAGGDGRLGNGGTSDSSTPVQVVGVGGSGTLTNIKAIARGGSHTVALKSDGTVYCWGAGVNSQLGNGGTSASSTPVQVVGVGGSGTLTGIKAIAGGSSHTIALKSDGTVYCWGHGGFGQLGNGKVVSSSTPVQVVGVGGSGTLTGIKAIAGGHSHTVALKSDGTVYGWGNGTNGRLGNNSTSNSSTPVQVVGVGGSGTLTGIKAIATGDSHTIALKSDGTVYTWGLGSSGQLGNGGASDSSTPVQVVGVGGSGTLTGIKAIEGGNRHTVALKSDGTVYVWGLGGNGQLGNGASSSQQSTPVQVKGVGGSGFLTGIKAIVAGSAYTVALKSDGTVYCWGNGANGRLGNGATPSMQSTPVQVVGVGGSGFLTGIAALGAGALATHTVVLKAEGTLTATGRNNSRQLGDNTGIDRNSPVNVVNVANPIGLSAGIAHSLTLLTDGTVKAWGHNAYGQCATGNTNSVLTPTPLAGLSNLVQVAAGTWHTLFLLDNGTLKAAGSSAFGQLGLPTAINLSTAVPVPNLTAIVAIAAGANHSLALDDDGTVYAWGNNTFGQLGQGNFTDSSTPLVVTLPESAIALASGAYHSMALGVSGTLYVWGRNGSQGQVGNGAFGSHVSSPYAHSLTGIIGMAGGVFHSLALDDGGGIHAWGGNEYGQLGDGLSGLVNNRNSPFEIASSGYIGVQAGAFHSLAIGDTGLGNAWGLNTSGQLGDGTNVNKTTPTALSTVYSLLTAGWYHSLLLP